MIKRGSKHVVRILITALVGGLLGATLVRFAPGFDADERELDLRLSEESKEALRSSHNAEHNIGHFYFIYLQGLLHGDLGFSRNLNRPAAELIRERFPLTLRELVAGLLLGWALGLLLAVPAAAAPSWPMNLFTGAVSGSLLSIPAAVLALIFVWLRWPASLAIGLLLTPKIFAYTRNLLQHGYGLPHVLTARSKGVGEWRVLLWHVIPPAAPQILALAGVSVSVAVGAAIPIEALCDQPGIGQLAWQAALARDLVLLVNLTLIVTLITVIANSISDMIGEGLRRGQA